MSDEQSEPKYVTRRTGRELAKRVTGVEIGKSTLDKDAMVGRGPRPVAKYGKADLYLAEEFLRYVRTKITRLEPSTS